MRKRTGKTRGETSSLNLQASRSNGRNMSDVAAAKREGVTPEDQESQLNAKRAKCDVTGGQGDQAEGERACKSSVLSGFVTSQVLNDSAREKKIFVHGKVRER